MKIAFVDLYRQYQQHKTELDAAITGIISSGAFIGGLNNSEVKKFENNYADYLGTRRCVACANGTDALEISLRSMGIHTGDEVLVPAISWISTAEAVSSLGATPVFVDIDPESYTIDPSLFESKITSKTRAIIPVHLYGMPADMGRIMAFAKAHNLLVLEDCAQAHGAKFSDQIVGTFGEMGSFSFYPGKNLGAYGDAGGIVTNDEDLANNASMIAQHGQTKKKFQHMIPGRNSRMDGLQAAVLNVKLEYLPEWTSARARVASRYLAELPKDRLILPKVPSDRFPVWHLFAVMVDQRETFRAFLAEREIPTGIQYPTPLPLLDAYRSLGGREEDFPVAVRLSQTVTTLPIFPEMTDTEIDYVVATIKEFFN